MGPSSDGKCCTSCRGRGSSMLSRPRSGTGSACATRSGDAGPALESGWSRPPRILSPDPEELPARSLPPRRGHYEYSSVATNKAVQLRTLWEFMAGRGGHEKTLGEL